MLLVLTVAVDALGAAAPVDDLGLVDLVARVVGGGEARRLADRAVDVDHPAARAADEVVVVVADAVLVARRRPRRLDAPQQSLVGERAEHVVHRLARDGADLGADDPVDLVGGAVRALGHRPQHGQPLRGHLHAVRRSSSASSTGDPMTIRSLRAKTGLESNLGAVPS